MNWIDQQRTTARKEHGRQKAEGGVLEEVKLLPHKNTLLNTDHGSVCHVGEC